MRLKFGMFTLEDLLVPLTLRTMRRIRVGYATVTTGSGPPVRQNGELLSDGMGKPVLRMRCLYGECVACQTFRELLQGSSVGADPTYR
jgi:hypothetical protein